MRGDEGSGFQHAITYFFGCFDSRIDRVDDTDEDSLVGLRVLLDDTEDPAAVLLARQLDIEVPDLELEQAGQELPVVHIRAMSRVFVAAGAGVDANTLPLRAVEPLQYAVVEADEGAERSEEHTSELQSPCNLVCRLLLEKKKKKMKEHLVEQRTVVVRRRR